LQYEHKTLQKMKENMEMYLQEEELDLQGKKTIDKEH